ncbi:Dabb family protein [Streptomyces sp. NPDC126499]|uniref:Dabb family protein n=1 Tax=Streptomyces sp. NPDC126499 TaxID=3155314 RepID=UPI0033273507
MIRHLVLFKLNDGVRRDEPRVVAGVEAFRALGAQIPELRFWECDWNITDRPIAYDFAINSAVEDKDALQRYLDHPAHQAGVALWREFATWVIADYEFQG